MKGFLIGLACALLWSVPAWAQPGECSIYNSGGAYFLGCVFAGTTLPGNQPISMTGAITSDGTIANTDGEFFYNIGGTTGSFTASGGECTTPDSFGNFVFQWTTLTGAPANTPTQFNEIIDNAGLTRVSAVSSNPGMVLVGTCD